MTNFHGIIRLVATRVGYFWAYQSASHRSRRWLGQSKEQLMTNLVKRFAADESGATAIEYGLIAAGISVAIITVVNTLGSQLKSTFTNISSQLATAGK
jgi:pilus assembly protein Flp/PilA